MVFLPYFRGLNDHRQKYEHNNKITFYLNSSIASNPHFTFLLLRFLFHIGSMPYDKLMLLRKMLLIPTSYRFLKIMLKKEKTFAIKQYGEHFDLNSGFWKESMDVVIRL